MSVAFSQDRLAGGVTRTRNARCWSRNWPEWRDTALLPNLPGQAPSSEWPDSVQVVYYRRSTVPVPRWPRWLKAAALY
jgi:hypothetical protein